MQVLDHHEKKRRASASSRSSTRHGQRGRSDQLNVGTPPPRSTRLRDQLVEKFHQKEAELVFDVRSIRRKLNYKQNLDERPQKRVKQEAIPCRCYLAVWDNREGHRQLEPILKRSEDCSVTPADTATDVHAVEMELEKPFRVPATEFFVPILDRNGELSKYTIGDRYFLEIKIIPCGSSQRWPPMPIMSKSEDSLMKDAAKRTDLAFAEGMLISSYTNLPHAPPEGVPLNVSFDHRGRTFKTKYGLEVNASWTYPHLLEARQKKEEEAFNRELEKEERKDPLCRSIDPAIKAKARASGPRLSEVTVQADPKVELSYIWDIQTKIPVPENSRKTAIDGLYCPMCPTHGFQTLQHLHFHLCNHHDKYKFRVESQEHNAETAELKSATLRVEVAEIFRQRAANHIKDEREFTWRRPPTPFDIDSYVLGEQSWVGVLPRKRTATAAQVEAHSSGSATAPPVNEIGRKTLFRPAAGVTEIPLPIRKKFAVPIARTRKQTTFYRSINHRTMTTGESLSETDEDIDESWLSKRQHDTTAEAEELANAEKLFRQKWNSHVMSEGSPSSRYVSDVLVRFARQNAAWLRGMDDDVDMLVQFQELLSTIVDRGLVDGRVLNDCLRIIRDGGVGKGDQVVDRKADVARSPLVTGDANLASSNEENNLESPSQMLGEASKAEDAQMEAAEAILPPEMPTNDESQNPTSFQNSQESGKTTGVLISELKRPEAKLHPALPASKISRLSVANGFCGICNRYILRPKRDAIICSCLTCTNRGIFFHLSCSLGVPTKLTQLERQTFRCKDCKAALPVSLNPTTPSTGIRN